MQGVQPIAARPRCEPGSENADRLAKLARPVLAVSGDRRRPLYHRFTSRSLADGEDSLLDLLRADQWDENRILPRLRRARTLTAQQPVSYTSITDSRLPLVSDP